MLGTYRLADDESWCWSSNHRTPAIGTSRWRTSGTNASNRAAGAAHQQGVTPDADGVVRIAIGANDFGHGHWLDTGGRYRGFVVFRWLDNPEPPKVSEAVRDR